MLLLTDLEKYMLPCLNKKLLGIECMGCGLQRSVSLLIQGEFVAAFQMYPAIYSLIALCVSVAANVFFKFKHSNKIITVLAIVTISTIIINFTIKLIN